jgi:hypothetical protein
MIGSMRAVGELVRCIDGSWMTRPNHARNGGADAASPAPGTSHTESSRLCHYHAHASGSCSSATIPLFQPADVSR